MICLSRSFSDVAVKTYTDVCVGTWDESFVAPDLVNNLDYVLSLDPCGHQGSRADGKDRA